jgi:hypothetical protein
MRTAAVCVTCMLMTMGICGATVAAAEESPVKENLEACKLPHGETILNDRNTDEAKKAGILRFSDGSMSPWIELSDRGFKSSKEALDFLRSQKVGDFIYSDHRDGAFLAISCRISDRGVQEGLQDGHCYLVETADGKYALVRLVQRRGRYALIQYVYQPDGTTVFEIPRGETIKVESPRQPPPMAPPPPPAAVAGKVTDVPTLLEIRKKMIAELMAVVAKEPKTTQENMAKGNAIEALGELRAAEAAPFIVEEITHQGGGRLTASDSLTLEGMFHSLGALRLIGKPASLAALDAIAKLQLDGPGAEETAKAKLRLKLLVAVIRGVEGQDVAVFMVRLRAEKAAGAAKTALGAALKELNAM